MPFSVVIRNVCITEVFNLPGVVQIDGICTKCGEHWKLTTLKDSLHKWIRDGHCTTLLPSTKLSMEDGLCLSCSTLSKST